jgi:polyphosphate kinase
MNTRFDPELSRLAFEERLIEFCEDTSIPVLDRVRLLAIVGERLDVFFMTRVGRLKRLAASGDQKRASTATPVEQLEAIAAEAKRMTHQAYGILERLLEELAAHDISIARWDALNAADREHLQRICGQTLDTLIRAIVVEPGFKFPHVRNLRPSLVALAKRSGDKASCLVIVELPAELPRLVKLARQNRFVPLEQIIAAELPKLCPRFEIKKAHLFRVTRNASTELDDDDDVRDFEAEIVRRPFQEVVRLEVEQSMPRAMRERLLEGFGHEDDSSPLALDEQDLYTVDGLVDLTGLEELANIDQPSLKRAPLQRRNTRLDRMLDATSPSADVLLHFPFDDYESSIGGLLHAAARHPQLESIQTTIYRTDKDSDVVAALRDAKARGAEANAVVEVKASFDERDNLELARSLEADGVRVVVAPPSLKVHAKVALVTLRRNDGPHRIALIGTGNMNAVTSGSYIDLWLVTQDPDRTRDVAALFDMLMRGASRPGKPFEHVFVSPFGMREGMIEMIECEAANARAGRPAGIRAMMNGLTDPATMDALNRASQAGVPIELMVRGVCLLQPGAPGVSDNIRIVSLAGHLLQHARIFHFRNGGNDRWFIGSADWRPRNFEVRVEVVTPVDRPEHIAMLDRILTATLGDSEAWTLRSDGVYVPVAKDRKERRVVSAVARR